MKIIKILIPLLLSLLLTSCSLFEQLENITPTLIEETTVTPEAPLGDFLSPRELWVMNEAPVVRNLLSDAEKESTINSFLMEGELLFQGKKNDCYSLKDVSELKTADLNSSLAIVFSFEEESIGEGVITISAQTKYNKGKKEIIAYDEQPEKKRFLLVTVAEIEKLIAPYGLDAIKYFNVNAYKGGIISSLYFLSPSTTEKVQSYLDEVADYESIIHTYDGTLSNETPSINAAKVYEYLKKTTGNSCLTGQMIGYSCYSDFNGTDFEMDYLNDLTGKSPAIMGFDFRSNEFKSTVSYAEECWNNGSIPTICWHTGIDFSSGYTGSTSDTLDWEKALTPGTNEYDALLNGIDRAAFYLKQLAQKGVPVLWRPFHEVGGQWFWWSRGGAENFKTLWQLMYDRYTDYWGLNNLIWVWGSCCHTGDMATWYPGDDYVDIIGADSYKTGAHEDLFAECQSIAPEGMPIVLHECGIIPTEQEMKDTGATWSYFMEWYSTLDENYDKNQEELKEIYQSDFFITRDELFQ